eukprot:scaffold1170_cov122-Cylindrotheca_fusiformis.AAC.32
MSTRLKNDRQGLLTYCHASRALDECHSIKPIYKKSASQRASTRSWCAFSSIVTVMSVLQQRKTAYEQDMYPFAMGHLHVCAEGQDNSRRFIPCHSSNIL